MVASGSYEDYQWDHRNRLTSVTFKTFSGTVTEAVEYGCDVFDRLISRSWDPDGPGSQPPVLTYFSYDGDQIILQFGGEEASDLSHRYLWSEMVDQLMADENVTSLTSVGTLLWPLADRLGTIRDLADYDDATETTSVANHRVFNSFGKLISESNSAVVVLFGETGRLHDEVTGLNYHHHRWLRDGRWLSQDPIGVVGEEGNPYRFIGNSPVLYVDPSGLWITPSWQAFRGIADAVDYAADFISPIRPIGRWMDSGNKWIDGKLRLIPAWDRLRTGVENWEKQPAPLPAWWPSKCPPKWVVPFWPSNGTVLSMEQLVIDVIGIFDPTPIADTANAAVGLGRGDYFGAAIDLISGFIPYLGDTTKVFDIPKYAGKFSDVLLAGYEGLSKMAPKLTKAAEVASATAKGGAAVVAQGVAGAAGPIVRKGQEVCGEISKRASSLLDWWKGGKKAVGAQPPSPIKATPSDCKNPKPNTLYESNGYYYKTDAQGRLSEASGDLRLKKADRNSYQQTKVGKSSGVAGDEGGHMIGAQFDGLGEGPLHLVPQGMKLNRGAGSQWTAMEREWANALNQGNKVRVKIEVDWASAGSKRPDGFRVTYEIIDGTTGAVTPRTKYFSQ